MLPLYFWKKNGAIIWKLTEPCPKLTIVHWFSTWCRNTETKFFETEDPLNMISSFEAILFRETKRHELHIIRTVSQSWGRAYVFYSVQKKKEARVFKIRLRLNLGTKFCGQSPLENKERHYLNIYALSRELNKSIKFPIGRC